MMPICKAFMVLVVLMGIAESSIVENLDVDRIINNVDQNGAKLKVGSCPINVRTVKNCITCVNDLPCRGNKICCPQDGDVNAVEGCCTPAVRGAFGRNVDYEDLQSNASEDEETDRTTQDS